MLRHATPLFSDGLLHDAALIISAAAVAATLTFRSIILQGWR